MNNLIKSNRKTNPFILFNLVILCLVLNSHSLRAENDRLITDYDANTYDNISYPGIEPPPITEKSSGIDERPLWRLLSDKKYDQVNKMIERYRGTYPNWQPPSDLMTALIRGQINEAILNENYDTILQMSQNHPEAFTCNDIDHMWALGNALHEKKREQDLLNHYQMMIEQCPDPDHRLVTLQRASTQLSYNATLDLINIELEKPHTAFEKKALDHFEYNFFTGWFADAWDRNAMSEAEIPVKHLQKPVIDYKDAKIAALLGWWEMQRNQPALARNWFAQALEWQPDPDTAYGYAIALRDSHQTDQAKKIIDQWQDREPRMSTLFFVPTPAGKVRPVQTRSASEIALDRAVRKYKKGDYAGSLGTTRSALKKTAHKKKQTQSDRALKMIEAWSLYHLSRTKDATSHFESLYRSQADIDSARGLVFSAIEDREYDYVLDVGNDDCGPLSFLHSTRIPTDQLSVASATSDLYYLFYKSWIGEELKQKNFRSVELKILKIADRIIELEDGEMAAAAGWAYLEKGDLGKALFWFERALAWNPTVDNAYGLAQTKRKLGDTKSAELLAEKWHDKSPQMRSLYGELLLERATREYEQQNYTQSLALARESAELNPGAEADKLIAWNKYQLGDVKQAAKDFERLYRNNPDKENADGLFTSLSELDDEKHLEDLAQELGGPLNDHVSDIHASQYYYGDQFILAEQARVNFLPELKNIDTAAISLTPYARHRNGEEGLGQLDMTGVKLAGRAFAGRHFFYISVDFMNLDSGNPAGNAQLGSNTNQLLNMFPVTPTDKASLLIEPTFSYRYASKISPYFSIGSTPLEGKVSGTPVGKLGIDWRSGEGKYNLELFAENKQESILSISGIVDPVTGTNWGRVVETGIRGNVQYQISDWWTLYSGGVFGNLDGHSVADNDHFGFWASLGYNIDRNGFKYLTVGPAYRFDHYDENRRFFTFGHGGYFSPDTFHRLGAEVNFQTDEAKQFVIKGRASLGYQYTSEDKAFAFPLTNTGPVLKGDDSHGVAFDTQLSGVYQLNPWIQVGAFVNITQSPDFDDVGGGLMLRINAYDRPAVFSFDLPTQPWND